MELTAKWSYVIYSLLVQTDFGSGRQRRIGVLGYNSSSGDLVIHLNNNWQEGISEDTREILHATIEQFRTMVQERQAPTVMHVLMSDCSHVLQLGARLACVDATHDSITETLQRNGCIPD